MKKKNLKGTTRHLIHWPKKVFVHFSWKGSSKWKSLTWKKKKKRYDHNVRFLCILFIPCFSPIFGMFTVLVCFQVDCLFLYFFFVINSALLALKTVVLIHCPSGFFLVWNSQTHNFIALKATDIIALHIFLWYQCALFKLHSRVQWKQYCKYWWYNTVIHS